MKRGSIRSYLFSILSARGPELADQYCIAFQCEWYHFWVYKKNIIADESTIIEGSRICVVQRGRKNWNWRRCGCVLWRMQQKHQHARTDNVYFHSRRYSCAARDCGCVISLYLESAEDLNHPHAGAHYEGCSECKTKSRQAHRISGKHTKLKYTQAVMYEWRYWDTRQSATIKVFSTQCFALRLLKLIRSGRILYCTTERKIIKNESGHLPDLQRFKLGSLQTDSDETAELNENSRQWINPSTFGQLCSLCCLCIFSMKSTLLRRNDSNECWTFLRSCDWTAQFPGLRRTTCLWTKHCKPASTSQAPGHHQLSKLSMKQL